MNMTTPPDDHTLNACLARVIGKEIVESYPGKDGSVCWAFLQDIKQGKTKSRRKFVYEKWDPLHDPVQMEEVEAWLRENGYEFGSGWSKDDGYYTAHVLLDPNPSGDPKVLYRTGRDIDKKRAFALAIWEMEQSQKGGEGE